MAYRSNQKGRAEGGFAYIMPSRPHYSASQLRALNTIYGSLKRGGVIMHEEAFELRKSALS